MRIPFQFEQCTVCLSKVELTWEHVIPKSIGGSIEIKSQCSTCNNDRLGVDLLPTLKEYYPVRLAINSLKRELPDLFQSIEHRLLYLAKDTAGKISTLISRAGRLRTRAKKEEDGSLVYGIDEAEGHLRRLLEKGEVSQEEIENALKKYSEADADVEVTMPDGSTVIKRKYTDHWQKPGPTRLDPRIPTLLAYNYLCVVLGHDIFINHLDGMRDFILNSTETEQLVVEEFPYTNDYAPYHRLWLETEENSTSVYVLLFGSIGLKVTIKNVVVSGGDYIVLIDLKGNRVLSAISFKEAKKGNIFGA